MNETAHSGHSRWWVALALCGAGFALALLAVAGGPEILKNAIDTDSPGAGNGINRLINTIDNDLKGPVNLAMITLVPLGIAAGGAMTAVGQRSGMALIFTSAGAGGLVALGNGIVA